jgi:PH domain
VKYVELRRGNLCYYDDSGQTSGRKIIHLRHNDTIVQACDRRSSISSASASGNIKSGSTSIDKANPTDNDVNTSSILPLTTLSRSKSEGAASNDIHGATSGGAGDASSNTNTINTSNNITGGGNAATDSTTGTSKGGGGGGGGGGGNEQRPGEGKNSSGGGRNSKLFCFEILQPGSPKHVWMARSEEERQSWLQAIRGAMIGSLEGDHADDDGKKRRKRQLDLVTHKKALDLYSHLRHDLQKASITSPQQYCKIVSRAMRKLTVNPVKIDPDTVDDCIIHESALLIPTLRIPVQWVRDQLVHGHQTSSPSVASSASTPASKSGSTHTTTPATSTMATTAPGRVTGKATAPHKNLKLVVADFWRNMSDTTFGVNGMVLPKESPYASERTVGALVRCIMEFDKAFNEDGEYDVNQSGLISELQAVAYARNILMTVLKSKQQQDVVCTINHLLQNDQVVLEPETSEDTGIVYLEVSFAGDDLPDDQTDTENEISLWFRTRRKNSATSMWKRRFAVLSGVVLSYYEAATPRPHGLRGQLVLSGATVQQDESFLATDASKDDKYVLLLATAAEERWLSFESEDDMKKWQVAIQEGIDSCDAAPSLPSAERGGKHKGKSILKLTESALKAAIPDSGIRVGARVVRGATGSGVRVIRSATDGSMKVFRTAVGMMRHIPSAAASAAAMATGAATTTTTKSSISRRPSMQMLMSNAAPLGGGGSGGSKREPTVQCVAEQTYSFAVYEAPAKPPPPQPASPSSDSATDPNLFREWKRETPPANPSTSSATTPRRLFTVNAKLFQAFLLTGGGKSGRLSRGDALIEMEFFFTSSSCVGIGNEEEAMVVVPPCTPAAATKMALNVASSASAQEEQQQRTRDFDDEYGFGGPITI